MVGTVELYHTSIEVFVQYPTIGEVHVGKRQVVVDIIDTPTSLRLLYQYARRIGEQFGETKRFLYLAEQMDRLELKFMIIFLLGVFINYKKMLQAIGHVIYRIERIGLMHLLLHHSVRGILRLNVYTPKKKDNQCK